MNSRIIFACISAFACAGIVYFNSIEKTIKIKSKKSLAAYTVGVAELSEISDSIEALGTVISDESVTITSSVTKKVIDVGFKDGEYVHKGDLLVKLDASQEEADEKRLELNLAEQQREFNRLLPLHKNGVVSSKEYETQHTRVLTAQTELDLMRAKIKEMYITAPFDGILGMRSVSIGSLVSAGTVITTIDAIKTVKVDFSIPEKYVLQVKSGYVIEARSEASVNHVFKGEVIAVSPRVDEMSHNVSVRGQFDNTELLLRPGMLLKLRLPLNTRMGICVTETAILTIGGDQYVYKIENGKPVQHKVKIGSRFFGKVEILEGLSPGDQYVTDGIISLK